jgi:RNA methyltransferase, TrmH family
MSAPGTELRVKTISSRQHPFVTRCREIASGRADESAAVLLDGIHLVRDALNAGIEIDTVAITQAASEIPEVAALIDDLIAERVEVVLASAPVIDAASPVRTPTGIVAIGRARPCPLTAVLAVDRSLIVAAVGVQDPGNMGALVRAADAAGATGVVATTGCASPFGWKALRGAMGSAFRVPIVTGVTVEELLAAAHARGIRTMALVPTAAESLYTCDLAGPVAVLVGGEGAGLDPETIEAADVRVRIPMAPDVESLNVAVAAAVVLFEARRQREAAPRRERP